MEDLLNACRVCGISDMYTNLFYNINKELLKNLTKIVEFEINDKDGLSKWICRECVEHVEWFTSVRIKYAETHKKNQPKAHHVDIKVDVGVDDLFEVEEIAWEDEDEFEVTTLSKVNTSRKRKASSDSLHSISKVFVEDTIANFVPASSKAPTEFATKRENDKILKELHKITTKLDNVAGMMTSLKPKFTKIIDAEPEFPFEKIDSLKSLDLLEEKLKAHYKQPTAESKEFVNALTKHLASRMYATGSNRLDVGLAKSFVEQVFKENFIRDQLGWTGIKSRIGLNGYEGILHLVMESANKVKENTFPSYGLLLRCFSDVFKRLQAGYKAVECKKFGNI